MLFKSASLPIPPPPNTKKVCIEKNILQHCLKYLIFRAYQQALGEPLVTFLCVSAVSLTFFLMKWKYKMAFISKKPIFGITNLLPTLTIVISSFLQFTRKICGNLTVRRSFSMMLNLRILALFINDHPELALQLTFLWNPALLCSRPHPFEDTKCLLWCPHGARWRPCWLWLYICCPESSFTFRKSSGHACPSALSGVETVSAW